MLSPDRQETSTPPQDLRTDLSEIRKGIIRLQPRPSGHGKDLVLLNVLPPIPISGFRNSGGDRNLRRPAVEDGEPTALNLGQALEIEIYRDEDAIYEALGKQPGEEY